MTLAQTLFSLQGRLRRQDWWVWSFTMVFVQLCLAYALLALFDPHPFDPDAPGRSVIGAVSRLPPEVRAAFDLFFLWPAISLGVKRWRDRGGFGWPVIALNLFLYALPRLPVTYIHWLDHSLPKVLEGALGIGLLSAAVWVLVCLAFVDGSPKPNRYGPAPKGPTEDAAEHFV